MDTDGGGRNWDYRTTGLRDYGTTGQEKQKLGKPPGEISRAKESRKLKGDCERGNADNLKG
jgi:hypothetical protein